MCVSAGETIYGRAVVDPSQELREGFYLMIERVHLCAGRNGYVPSYDPANKHYGCLEPSIELSHRFKILVSYIVNRQMFICLCLIPD